jgi:hypothetical protein
LYFIFLDGNTLMGRYFSISCAKSEWNPVNAAAIMAKMKWEKAAERH